MKICSFEGCGKTVEKLGLCGGHYQQQRKGKTLTLLHRSLQGLSLEERFHKSYDTQMGDDPCWIWNMAVDKDGYGKFTIASSPVRAHRYSLELHTGQPIPDGLEALHHCDIPGCVNPKHLYAGSHNDNIRDKVSRGRQYRKLSTEKVKFIKESSLSRKELADMFGVSLTVIHHLVKTEDKK